MFFFENKYISRVVPKNDETAARCSKLGLYVTFKNFEDGVLLSDSEY